MGQPVVPSLNGRVRLPGRGLLVLEVAIVEDSGSYTCVCTSRAGKAEASVTLQVYGPPPPPVLLSAVPLSSQSIYLLWKWSGLTPDPPQRIDSFRVWYKEKQSERALIYPTVLGSNMTRLEVEGLKPHAEYVFYITVQGDSGTSPPSNLLSAITLQAEPSPPQNLRTIKISRTSVTITWEVPATPNGIIKEYQLMYQRLGDIYDDYTILNISFPEFPTHETTLSDLRPYTKYTVKVKAANVESGVMLWGDFSPPLVFWTLMSVPALPPQFVEVTSDSPYSIQVSWQEIPNLAQNGPILFYHVTCIEAKSGKSDTVRVEKSSKKTEIFGLFPWRNYTVTVRGENPKGLSPSSDPFIGLTLPIAPVAPPSNLKVDSRSSSTLTLHWERLPDELVTCNITAYKIEYRQSGDPDWTSILAVPIILSSSLMQHTIDSLRSWTWYEARVAAFTASITPGLGPFTEPVMARTTQGESGPVTAVSFTSDENTIVLSWQPPKTVNGILAGYKVSYQPFSATTVTAEPPMDTLIYSNRSMTLTDLHPGTLYQVRIYAVNGAGLGQETVLRIYTLPYSPSDTTELTIYNASSAEPEMFTGSEINLSERISSSHIRKNLAAIVAGSLVGAVALTICTIFICIQCIKYRRKQRLDYIVSEDCVIISNDSSYFRPNESSLPADDFLSSPKPSLPFYSAPATSLSSSSSPQTLSGIVVTQPHQQPPVSKTTRARSLDSQSQTWNEKICDKRLDTSTNGSTEINGTNEQEDGYSSTKKSDLSRKRSFGGGVSLPQLLSKSYSKLDEDGNESVEGLENPMYQKPVVDVDEVVLRVHDSRSGFSRSQLRQSVKSFDTDSITSNTMRRKNKMRTESAAAIAVLRSTASSCNNILDTDTQDAEEEVEDFGSEVIFNERTVL
ncbi:receptor-type tyrosine-protein phosphatase s [Plakobranchus ocellatus]|uniref:Receptor-type tyrosine-protein phosphatase s n=1 Tax=Plakobranchus ocellatus TaxID=259542 RepID=A0AAV4AS06_9GAST|nr:receptor-type tyrosine-protein phosphatase s [Plakobranchus ocellatus]